MKTIKMDYVEYQQLVQKVKTLEKLNQELIDECKNGKGAVVTWNRYNIGGHNPYERVDIEIPTIESATEGFVKLEKMYEGLRERVMFRIDKSYSEGLHDGKKFAEKNTKKRKWYQIF